MLHERVDASPQTATLGRRSLRYASSSYLVSMDCLVYGTSENMRPASAEDISRPVAGARIAVVDDEPSVTRFLSRLLSIHGYYVLAEDPVRILGRLREEPDCVDLLVTDQSMPNMTGTELVAFAREVRPTLPVLLITGHIEVTTLEEVERWGRSACVAKPIDTNELIAKVTRLLAQATLH